MAQPRRADIEGGVAPRDHREPVGQLELAEAEDPEAHLEAIKERLNRVRSPYRSAEFFEIEEIIDPRDSRAVLCRWAKLARRTLVPGTQAFTYRP